MRTALVYISVLAVLASAFVSCRREGKGIPRGEMAEIYAEMFVLDQEIAGDPDIRREADTLFVYEPGFRKYGYTADDYRSSMAYYIQDPDRYVRILKRTVDILDGRRKELKSEKDRLESISQSQAITESFRPERIYFLSGLANRDRLTVDSLAVYIDSTGGSFDFDVQKGYDTLYSGPRICILNDTLSVSDSVPGLPVPEKVPGETAVGGRISGDVKLDGRKARISDRTGDRAEPLKMISAEVKKIEL